MRADLLVRAGATVMFSEVTEVRDAVHLLTPRAINQDVARALIREMRWYDDYLARGSPTAARIPRPATSAADLSNVVEKALGSIAKAGSSALMAVAAHGETSDSERAGLRRDAGQRFHLRHAAACLHEPARVYHRRGTPTGWRWCR